MLLNNAGIIHVATTSDSPSEVEITITDRQELCPCLQKLIAGELTKPVVIPHCEFLPPGLQIAQPTHISIPLRMRDQPLGILNLIVTDDMLLTESRNIILKGLGNELEAAIFRFEAYTEGERRVLTTIADQYSAALERSQLYETVKQLAMIDPLTGLYNRRYFFEMAQHAVEHAARYSRPISVLMVDIDHFKKVNDTYGHAGGDVVLQVIGRQCQSNMRKADILGRYGGEEFVILLPETGLREATQVAERLRQSLAALQIQTDAGLVSITASLGAAGLEGTEGSLLESLLDHADQALYQAKAGGRNQVSDWRENL